MRKAGARPGEKTETGRFPCTEECTKQPCGGKSGKPIPARRSGWFEFLEEKKRHCGADRTAERQPAASLHGTAEFHPPEGWGAAAVSGGAGGGASGGRRRVQADPAQRRRAGILRGRRRTGAAAAVSGKCACRPGTVWHQRVSGAVSGFPAGIRRRRGRDGAGGRKPGSGGAAVRPDGSRGTAGGGKPAGVPDLRAG